VGREKSDGQRLSVIIPVLNEERSLGRILSAFKSWERTTSEIIVVDGGSTDGTLDIARDYPCTVISAAKGRASQMNAGADYAAGEILLFLHADTTLPVAAAQLIEEALHREVENSKGLKEADWGWFDVRLDGDRFAFRVIEWFMTARARLTRVCTGDQALFVRRALFEAVGRFPELPLMEDVALSKTLRRAARAKPIAKRVITSSRRWQTQGVVRTVLLMWELRLRYFLGESPQALHKRYYPEQRAVE
jgi:rSAM/selenodomain-associated transferase 2